MITFAKENIEKRLRHNERNFYVRFIYHLDKNSIPFAKFYDCRQGYFFSIGEKYFDLLRISKWYERECYDITSAQGLVGSIYPSHTWFRRGDFELSWKGRR